MRFLHLHISQTKQTTEQTQQPQPNLLTAYMLQYKNRMDSVSSSREGILLDTSPPTVPRVHAGPGPASGRPRVGVFASSPPLSGCTTWPGQRGFNGWRRARPQADPFARFSRPQLREGISELLTQTLKAVGTTTEPTGGANWCFSMPACRRKLPKRHRQWGFRCAIYRQCHLQGTGTQQGESENATTRINKSVQLLGRDENQELYKLSVQNTHHKSRRPRTTGEKKYLF